MLGIPALIAGLILDFAGGSWFPGASTVGLILTVVGAVFTILTLCLFMIAASGTR